MNFIDAVVINYKDLKRTENCVLSLLNEQLIERIYVVDNESTKTLLDQKIFQDARVRIIEVKENRGFAGGVNLALMLRKEDGSSNDVLFINNDAELSDSALMKLSAQIKNEDSCEIACPAIINPDGSIQALGHKISFVSGKSLANKTPRRIDYASWACVLISNQALRRVGNLDERFFMYWEDVDFGIRAKQLGIGVALVPEAKVIHELSASKHLVGDKLRFYFAWSLHQMSRKYGYPWKIKALFLVSRMTVKQLLAFNLPAAKSIYSGWNAPANTPAYQYVPNLGSVK